MHGDSINAVTFAAPIVPQIGVRTMVQQPRCRFDLVAVTCPQERRAAEWVRVDVPRDERCHGIALVVSRRPVVLVGGGRVCACVQNKVNCGMLFGSARVQGYGDVSRRSAAGKIEQRASFGIPRR